LKRKADSSKNATENETTPTLINPTKNGLSGKTRFMIVEKAMEPAMQQNAPSTAGRKSRSIIADK
jgi:hypothetical protein